jgi:Tol biopolymer transport system component
MPAVTETQGSGEVALRVAMETETVKGDLRAAIEQYKAIAAGRDRALAAKALMRMAECYQKLGDGEARATYARIVREFADQKDEVAVARTRLAGTAADSRGPGERLVPLDPTVVFPGTVSADGRFVSYANRRSGDVFVRDLSTGMDRPIRRATPSERGSYSVMSRDGKQVAFTWAAGSGKESRILVANAQGTGAPEARPLALSGVASIMLLDWSPDGKWLAAFMPGGVGLVSAVDGTLRIVKSGKFSPVTRSIFFSPDSKSIAYNVDVDGTSGESRIYVTAIDGTPRENVVVDHPSENLIMGWSPDGASLLFASDRNGSLGLWRLPIRNGQSNGNPTLIKTQAFGSNPVSLGVTSSGTLNVWRFAYHLYLHVAPIDLASGTLLDRASSFREFVGGGGKPTWSPDGQQLAYTSCQGSCSRTVVVKIRSMDTWQSRELPKRLAYHQAQTDLVWSPDGGAVTVSATDVKGRSGFYQIDTQGGEARPSELTSSGTPANPFHGTNVTADGTKVFFSSPRVGGRIIERDIASGTDRVVFEERAPGNAVFVHSSPDRRYTAFVETTDTMMSTLFLMPYGGGEPKQLFQATTPPGTGRHGMAWTTDGRAILMITRNTQGQELWLVPVSDGRPRKLDIDVTNWQASNFHGGFALHPGGRLIAFVAGEVTESISAFENILPASVTTR